MREVFISTMSLKNSHLDQHPWKTEEDMLLELSQIKKLEKELLSLPEAKIVIIWIQQSYFSMGSGMQVKINIFQDFFFQEVHNFQSLEYIY